jgi:putative DNA primase/helicase
MATIFRRLFPGSPAIFEPEIVPNCQSESSVETTPSVGPRTVEPTGRQVVSAQPSAGVEQGDRLLDEIVAAVRRHVVLPDGAAEMIALFAVHAHAHDAAQFSPVLSLVSADSASGKTTLLRALAALTPSPLAASNVSMAGLYRTISWRKHTLLIDEADTFLLRNNELRSILNSGHCRDTAYVLRADGNFRTWCPKVIALIGELPTTLRNRSLRIALKRKRPDEKVAHLDGAALASLKQLGARVAIWTQQHHDRLAAANPAIPQAIINRAADNWAPLLAIAEAAGGHWPRLAREVAVKALADDRDEPSVGVALLSDIRTIFNAIMTDRIPTAALIKALASIEERSWSEWSRGRPITASQLARILRPYGIGPQTVRFGTDLAKGYMLLDFDDAFRRYV